MGEFDHIAAAMRASPLTAAFMEMAETNDFSRLDKNTAKRHHFLPQFLLRGFSHTYHGKGHIFQMETRSRRAPVRVGVRSAAVRTGLYAAPDEDGELSNRNEGYLALVESHAAPALRPCPPNSICSYVLVGPAGKQKNALYSVAIFPI